MRAGFPTSGSTLDDLSHDSRSSLRSSSCPLLASYSSHLAETLAGSGLCFRRRSLHSRVASTSLPERRQRLPRCRGSFSGSSRGQLRAGSLVRSPVVRHVIGRCGQNLGQDRTSVRYVRRVEQRDKQNHQHRPQRQPYPEPIDLVGAHVASSSTPRGD